MLAQIPKGVYTMKSKLVIIRSNAETYRKANRKQKSQLLKELCQILHMNKQYLASLLRNSGKEITRKGKTVVIADPTLSMLSKRGRKKVYDASVEEALKKIWRLTGYASSKHLVGFIRLNHEILFNHPELRRYVNERIKALLLKISHSTLVAR